MKKSLSIAMAILLLLSQLLLAACSSDNEDAATPKKQDVQNSINPNPSAGNDADDTDADDDEATEWWVNYNWRFEGRIEQNEEFGSLVGQPGMYADYIFDIYMAGGRDPVHDTSTDYAEGFYDLAVASSIVIDTDEAADRILNEMLGGGFSGMDLGIDVVLSGEHRSDIPYYLDNEGNPVTPPYDSETETYIFPEGTEDAHAGAVYVHRVVPNWKSPIKDKNGQTVQPPTSSWLMYDCFEMEYTGASSHALVGTFGEDVKYFVYLFVVIDQNYHAKIYLNLTTSENHAIWLEGSGELILEHDM